MNTKEQTVIIGPIKYLIDDEYAYAYQYNSEYNEDELEMNVILPDYITYNGKNYDVIDIYDEFFFPLDDVEFQYAIVNNLSLNKHIYSFNTYVLQRLIIRHFSIDKENPNVYFKDNTIYNKSNNEEIVKLYIIGDKEIKYFKTSDSESDK